MGSLMKWLIPVVAIVVGYYAGSTMSAGSGLKQRDVVQTTTANPLFKGGEGQGSLAGVTAGEGKIIKVEEGQLIQDAIVAANPGDTVAVYPGTYSETVYIDKDNITLSGVVVEGEWPILDGKGELNDAVLYSGNNVIVENLYIKRYKGNGVMGQAGNNFVIRNNIIDDAGVYGIFPQFGQNGLISGNIVSEIADAAIYVGMSDYIDVVHNEVFDSVAGIEIENSRHALVEGNYVYNNTGGILAFITPGLPIKTTYDVIIRKNFVVNNNHVNFAAPGSTVSKIPQGTGVIIQAADDVVVEDNIISGNDSLGIAVATLNFAGQTSDLESEPNPDGVTILNNVMHNNGNNPDPVVKAVVLTQMQTRGPDIADMGPGKNKCILNGSRYRTLNLDNYTECDFAAKTTYAINTMTMEEPAAPFKLDAKSDEELDRMIGKRGYFAICSGCHAYEGHLIGPSVVELQAIYEENPEAMAEYIAEPMKVRENYPEMPPQAHLSERTRLAISEYVLKVTNNPNKKKKNYQLENAEEKSDE